MAEKAWRRSLHESSKQKANSATGADETRALLRGNPLGLPIWERTTKVRLAPVV
jgi:hypothetical protein